VADKDFVVKNGLVVANGDVTFIDGGKAIFGAGSDLQIYHNGVNSIIQDAGPGNLNIQAGNFYIQNAAGTQNMLAAIQGGALYLSYAGGTRIATTNTGFDVTGNANFGDNGKAIFGVGSDLQIYHNGTHSYITDSGTGDLKILGQNVEIGALGGQLNFKGVSEGASTVYYNNAAKLATTSTGIDVTGTVTAASFIGVVTGNATTATTLQTARNINLGGVLSGSASFNGAGDITITAAHTSDPVITLTGGVTGTGTMNNLGSVTIETTGGEITLNTLDLNAIAISKGVTATDVFVYDTSRDSDRGAWRNRTQGTSWYNESLNTATRGSRREFPSVAIIIAELNKITIYDGDDPTCPMWMVITALTSYDSIIGFGNNGKITSIAAMNGSIAVGVNLTSGTTNLGVNALFNLQFPADECVRYRGGDVKVWTKGLATRIISPGISWWINSPTISTNGIVNVSINDVAMAVLPDAPYDSHTGLQIPTISVATNGGLSIIKDDGTVVHLASSIGAAGYEVYKTWFDSHINLYAIHSYDTDGGISTLWSFFAETLRQVQSASQSSDQGNVNWGYTGRATCLPIVKGSKTDTSAWFMKGGVATGRQDVAIIGDTFLSQAQLDFNDFTDGLVNYTSTSYTSGWMPGNIKGAFLADTDATSLVGSGELVTNGDFATTTIWIAYGIDSASSSISGGVATIVGNSGYYQSFPTIIGRSYRASVDVNSTSGSNSQLKVGTTSNGEDNLAIVTATVASYSGTFIATATTTFVNLKTNYTVGSTQSTVYDNISVKLVDADRSVNSNGLVVNGTITRTPVDTGSELVGYSGFSASNYLEQPYNSALDFGTADFSIMGWVKATSDGYIVETIDAANTEGFAVFLAGTKLYFRTRNVNNSQVISASTFTTGIWTFFSATLTSAGTQHSVYVNGRLDASTIGSVSRSLGGINTPMRVGVSNADTSALSGSIALLRVSATAPSAEQIAKIYHDEKYLFQAGAACTLYGTSNAVTALSHDDATDLLHVGTSAGRSTFDGLRRVSNTTTAVDIAISAVDNLVVEE
jgi:hypothetical protein